MLLTRRNFEKSQIDYSDTSRVRLSAFLLMMGRRQTGRCCVAASSKYAAQLWKLPQDGSAICCAKRCQQPFRKYKTNWAAGESIIWFPFLHWWSSKLLGVLTNKATGCASVFTLQMAALISRLTHGDRFCCHFKTAVRCSARALHNCWQTAGFAKRRSGRFVMITAASKATLPANSSAADIYRLPGHAHAPDSTEMGPGPLDFICFDVVFPLLDKLHKWCEELTLVKLKSEAGCQVM